MSPSELIAHEFEMLLEFLRRSRGFDFTGYKRPSLMRRVQKRMQDVKVESIAEYMDYLEVHPDEFVHLFNTILINVTSFFRDAEAWKYLAEDIVPQIVAGDGGPIRVWSAGCASGEEPYSIAMMFAEAMGIEAATKRIKIYATDVDEEALSQARRATYTEHAVESVSDDLRAKYFVRTGDVYAFKPELRRTVIFGRHDISRDAPISRLDLLLCRNLMMYLNSETQSKVLARLYYALKPSGFLFLGKAEMLFSHTPLFRSINLKHRVFAKLAGKIPDAYPTPQESLSAPQAVDEANVAVLTERYFRQAQDPGLIVNGGGTLVLINERAQSLLGILQKDVGRQFKELEISYRPIDLRVHIARCSQEKVVVTSDKIVRILPDGSKQCLQAQLWPLLHDGGDVCAVGIKFEDLSDNEKLLEKLHESAGELERANEELQSAREELETTNEELQSSNDELATTNEELQSTNEELETMNEELQSTNTELDTTSQELRRLYDDLNRSNSFLESVLSSIESAVIVLDEDKRVIHWSDHSMNLWGLRADEVVGKNIEDLDFGLPVDALKPSIERVLSREAQFLEVELPSTNRRGARIRCAVKLAQRKDTQGRPVGVVLLMNEAHADPSKKGKTSKGN